MNNIDTLFQFLKYIVYIKIYYVLWQMHNVMYPPLQFHS